MADKIPTVTKLRRKSYTVLEKKKAILWYNDTKGASYSQVFKQFGVAPKFVWNLNISINFPYFTFIFLYL